MTEHHSRVTVVVPCYNEELRLDVPAFERCLRTTPWASFLFVDDGSRDDTLRLLREVQQRHSDRARVLALPRNVGKAEAVRQGMRHAIDGAPAYVAFWDADLSTPLDILGDFCRLLDGHPDLVLVMGARIRLLGRAIERPTFRHYTGRIFATAASIVLRLPVYDTQCGAKVFRVSAELDALLAEPFRTTWIFDVELLARLIRERDRSNGLPAKQVIYELPLLSWADVAGSKLHLMDYVRAARDLWRIHRVYLAGRRPSQQEKTSAVGAPLASRRQPSGSPDLVGGSAERQGR